MVVAMQDVALRDVALDEKPQPHTNGSLKRSKAPNGANGHPVSATPSRSIPRRRQKGLFARAFSVTARVLTWYCIITIFFRCPDSLEACKETTPKVCKAYFHAKHAIVPHVNPYYDAYAAPYVELARPYYENLDQKVITPGRVYAVKYGGPRIAQAQALGYAQWQNNVQPQVLKYQALAKAQYDQTLSSHVNKAATIIAPYYDVARTNALQTYHDILVPGYVFVYPYATQGYEAAYDFTKTTIIPTAVWAWDKAYIFLDSAVWPHVRDVYVLKVEPQLVRIGERLGRYNEKKSLGGVEDTEPIVSKSTFVKPTPSVTSTAVSATKKAAKSTSQTSDVEYSPKPNAPAGSESESSEEPKTKEEIRRLAAQTVEEDLELWQGQFSKVAEEGASEIEDRVDEISERMIEHRAGGMGKSLIAQLEATTESELKSLKTTILEILQNQKNEHQKRDDMITSAVRAAGLKIKDKAQNIRDWRQSYEQETEIAVTKAAEEHFNILEQTRDLALQKIGMKWAWMDGVTYKDWQKYHQLKDRFDEWTEDLKQLVTTHPGLVAAQARGAEIENQGMAIAHEAAAELGRLKQVAAWKATAEDFTDDFDSSTMQLAAEAVEKRILAAAESARLAAEAVIDKVSIDTDVDEGSSNSIVTDAEEAETVTVSLSQNEPTPEDLDTSAVPPLESLAAEPTEVASDLRSGSPSAASSGPDSHADDSTSTAKLAPSSSGSDPVDGPEQLDETLLESADLPIHTIVNEGSPTTVKSALFGAAASSVPSQQPILDDDVFSSASSVLSVAQSDMPASITSAAQAAYTAAIAGAADQYARAISAVSAQISGKPKPVQEELLSSVSSGYFSAMAAANSRLNEALTAASGSIYGTPTTNRMPTIPTLPSVDWERIQSIAQQKYDDSVNWASEQYEQAMVAIGAAEPTPGTYLEAAEKRAEKLVDQAKHNYFAGVGIAHARYSEFLAAASSAASSLTATPTPTNIQESASSAISAASGAAESVASSVGEMAGDAKDSIDETWNLLVSRVSSQVYGAPTPTPWYADLYAAAGEYASQFDNIAGSATDAVADRVAAASSLADDYAASASSAASAQYVVVSSLVSELVVGKEPSYTESVYSRLAHAYATGLASASSIGSEASATAASAASKISEAASSGLEVAASSIASATDKAKDTVEHIKDEL